MTSSTFETGIKNKAEQQQQKSEQINQTKWNRKEKATEFWVRGEDFLRFIGKN